MKQILLYLGLYFFLIIHSTEAKTLNLGAPEALLDEMSFNYQYQTGDAVHISFEDGNMTYKWIAGSRSKKSAKTFPYNSRKIEENIFFVNWHEPNENNFVSLIFNFNSRTVSSSVIVNYRNETPFITFQGGVIESVRDKGDLIR